MSTTEIKDALSPLFANCKFKGMQNVHFLIKDTIEVGLVTDVKPHEGSSAPSYIITFLNDNYILENVRVEEEDIFSSYDELYDYAKDVFSKNDLRCILKHFVKTQFCKDQYQEGLPLDEYIFQPVIK